MLLKRPTNLIPRTFRYQTRTSRRSRNALSCPGASLGRVTQTKRPPENPVRFTDLVLLAPESEQPKLMAYALSELGHAMLDKSGAVEGGSTATH
jgi:hypothetical protein